MTTSYTDKLRPRHQRVLTVKEEQLLQAGKRLPGDTQKRVFENQPKGYHGAAINPWRTGKRQVKRVVTVNGRKTWTDESKCSKKAKGLPATVNVVDNNGDLTTAHKKVAEAYRPEALPRLETATPWQGQVKETPVKVTRKATPWATQQNTEVTPQTKPVAYDRNAVGQGLEAWQVVEPVEGFTPATTQEREAAVAEQVETFGKSVRARHAKQCKGWEKKQESWKQLIAVAREGQTTLSLSTNADEEGNEPGWTPTCGDYLAELVAAEQQREWKQTLNKALANLTDKQREAVELTAMGMPLNGAQRQALLAARRKG